MRRHVPGHLRRRAHAELFRQYSNVVVAWGRNLEGQCGVKEYHPVLMRPLPVAELPVDVASIAAGKSHSAAVSGHGEVWTWGEGKEGKLGHGCADNTHLPSRVESLVGRADVCGVALGRHHSLFLDSAGKVWSCGENKEGQCGLGTPLQELAKQRRQEWDRGALAKWGAAGPAEVPAAGGGSANAAQHLAAQLQQAAQQAQQGGGVAAGGMSAAAAAAQQQQQQQSYEQQAFERDVEYYSQQQSWHAANLMPFLDHSSRAAEILQAQQLFDNRLKLHASGPTAWQRYLAASGAERLDIPGLAPGQIPTPVPVGRDRQALMSTAALFDPGLAAETATSLAACRYFSAVSTAAGQVWTFGGGFNGELGSGASWSSAARPVEGELAELLAEHGGATKVVAGGSFCAALTQSGAVVLWGQPRGGAGAGAELELPNMRARRQGGLLVAEFVNLPRMTDLAAGYSHLLMTDGEAVWALGQHRGPADLPSPAGSAGTAASSSAPATESAAGLQGQAPASEEGQQQPWLQPQLVLRPGGGEGVESLAAGGFASAAVTGNGRLFMWGTLLQKEAAEALLSRASSQGFGHWSYSSTAAPQPSMSQWGWAGLHSRVPALVEGLGGRVGQVALGTFHALAVLRS